MHYDGWDSWLRVLTPGDMEAVSQDLNRISENDLRQRLPAVSRADQESEVSYAAHYLQQAKSFVSNLVTSGRGMVYLIG